MEDASSWLGGHDWTSVEKTQVGHNMDRLLLPSEEIHAEAHAVILVNVDVAGTLLVTNFRLIFVSNDEIMDLGTIPVATIEKFAKQQPLRAHARNHHISARRLLQIVGKDMRTLAFAFRPHMKQRRNVYDALLRWTRPLRLWDLYAFSSVWAKLCGNHGNPRSRLGSEYLRIVAGKDYWQLSNVNSDYMLSPTYPSLLVLPAALSDEEIQQAACFRGRGRLPTLSWQHPDNGAVLARSSQPLVGLMMNGRSNADEKLVAALCTPMQHRDQKRKLYIADARPRKNALANGALGGGSESSANYSQCEVVYLGIDNIHAMRDSFVRLRDVLDVYGNASSDGSASLLRSGGSIWGGGNFSSTAEAISAFQESNWLTHVHNILGGALWIAARIAVEGASVLVHCSDGWDRTSQLVSLAEIMLDPYYRTITGFQALIEKDWLAFGHPFADRLGLPTFVSQIDFPVRAAPVSSYTNAGTQMPGSPIFLQWIDCVAQLLRLYPREFEFSSAFLVELVDSVLSCRFGNFLCNSEKERMQAAVNESAACIWSHFNSLHAQEGKGHRHFNIFYKEHSAELIPPAAALAPTLWPQFYLRWAFAAGRDKCASGDEIHTEARTRILSLEKTTQQAEEKRKEAEGRMKSLVDKVRFLEESLRVEKTAHSSAKTVARRAQTEASSIKKAVQSMGSLVNVDAEGRVSIRTLDAGDESSSSTSSSTAGLKDKNSRRISPRSNTESSTSNQLLRATSLENWGLGSGNWCSWPQAACPRLGSAMDGLVVNFDALKGVSIADDYFELEGGGLRGQSPGVT